MFNRIQKTINEGLTSLHDMGNATVNWRIFWGTISVAVLTLMVKFVALFRELIVSRQFGTGELLDAFLMAVLVPSACIQILAVSFGSAFIPAYLETRTRQGQKEASTLASCVVVAGSIVLVAVALMIWFSAEWFVPLFCSGFRQEMVVYTVKLVGALLPVLVFSGIGAICGAILNAVEKLSLVAVVPAVSPLVTICFLLVFERTQGVDALVAGTLLGSILEGAIVFCVCQQAHLFGSIRPMLVRDALSRIVRQYFPILVGSFVMSSSGIVDMAMAAMIAPGQVASYSFGTRVVTVVVGIIATGIGTAVLPQFSQMAANCEWKKAKLVYLRWCRLLLVALMPVMVAMIWLTTPMITILFQGGSFSSEDTAVVSGIQVCYALQIPFYVVNILGVRMLSATRRNQWLLALSIINLIINVVANYAFMQFIGVAGIALSTSLVYLLSSGALTYFVVRVLDSCAREDEAGKEFPRG